jgi:glycerol-1-phosphate dehydrogenase [NAD(P)+]
MNAATLAQRVNQRVNEALWEGAMTRRVVIGTGALGAACDCFRHCFPDATAMVVADRNTYDAAGRQIQRTLTAFSIPSLAPFLFDDEYLSAEYRHVERLRTQLAEHGAVAISVGAGTINDLVKLASAECGRKYLSVATAASMDGYTSFGASITREGYKQTLPCPAPLAVVVDLDVLAAAPSRLNAAGYADLLAKVPAGADWLLADALGVEPIDERAWTLVQRRLKDWLHDPPAVRRGDPTALAGLIEGLLMTGLGMQWSGTTRPASGAEHQFSHLWDMQHHTHRGAAPMHGEKVGIGSIASAAVYERVLRQDGDAIGLDSASIRNRWPAWQFIEAATRAHFDDPRLADQIVEQQRQKYLGAEQLTRRLAQLKTCWGSLRERLREQLLPAEQIRDMLAAVGAPHRPEDIGISPTRLKKSHILAQQIRSRFTVLDLVFQAGWWDDCVEALFRPGGIWHG